MMKKITKRTSQFELFTEYY